MVSSKQTKLYAKKKDQLKVDLFDILKNVISLI
jgi:hypothetical protein